MSMETEKVYLKQNLPAEPLFNQGHVIEFAAAVRKQ